MSNGTPIFLGTAQRAVKFHMGWDLSRLSSFIFVPYFPFKLPDIALILGLPKDFVMSPRSFELKLTSLRRNELASTITVESAGATEGMTQEYVVKELAAGPQVLCPTKAATQQVARSIVHSSASHCLFILPSNGFQVLEPTQIRVDYLCNGESTSLGLFSIDFLKTPPLSPSEVREIRRRGHGNVATIRIQCKGCGDVVIYKSINFGPASITSPYPTIQIEALPDRFVCSCGQTYFDTLYLKLGMHELFRHNIRGEVQELNLVSCYPSTAISSVLAQYKALISGTPPEEKVQVFLTENPVMWSFLGPLATIPKPRISTRLTADFAILTPTKTLYLVELEKPQTKLSKVHGGQAAELQAGKDQINNWRTWINDHRQAVLEGLQIPPAQAQSIRYILVAGMASDTPHDELRAVRQGMREDTEFFTFDELAGFVQSIDRSTRDM